MKYLIIIILLASCRPTSQNVTRVEFDSLKTNLLIQVDAKVESTAVRVVPAFIGKAMGQYVQQLSDSLVGLKKKSAAQAKEISALKSTLKQNTDTLMMLKKSVMSPYPGHFDYDSRTGFFYIKGVLR